jgi:hypothetical protein
MSPMNQFERVDGGALRLVQGGDKQADFVTGLAAGYAADAAVHAAIKHLEVRFPAAAPYLSLKGITQLLLRRRIP